MITGHEFDLDVHPPSQSTKQDPQPSVQNDQDDIPPIVTERRRPQPSSSGRPRPTSMPPQSLLPPSRASTEATTGGQVDRRTTETTGERSANGQPGTQGRSRGTRILGDYTLGKTLGAGSMGKVKLAQHNVTGEKVSGTFPAVVPIWTATDTGALFAAAGRQNRPQGWHVLSNVISD